VRSTGHKRAAFPLFDFGAASLPAATAGAASLEAKAALNLMALLLANFVRQWIEFDFEKAIWTIPAARAKMQVSPVNSVAPSKSRRHHRPCGLA
jgi:hypothetical protein